jgi:type I restriction enzyme, R subunit
MSPPRRNTVELDRRTTRSRGWLVPGRDLALEYEVGFVGDHGFSDYALPGEDGSIRAMVEAKRFSRDALAGQQQAAQYTDSIERRRNRRTPAVWLAACPCGHGGVVRT